MEHQREVWATLLKHISNNHPQKFISFFKSISNVISKNGCAELCCYAILHKCWQVLDYLLTNANLNINYYTFDSPPILYVAVENNIPLSFIQTIIKKGANVCYKNKNSGLTCLLEAANNCSYEIAECLLQNGANIEDRDTDVWYNSLTESVFQCNLPFLKLCLKYGANIHSFTKYTPPPLIEFFYCLENKNPTDFTTKKLILIELLHAGADVNCVWRLEGIEQDITPIHCLLAKHLASKQMFYFYCELIGILILHGSYFTNRACTHLKIYEFVNEWPLRLILYCLQKKKFMCPFL